ncbi:hypothetical protein [Endozoicomonas numazuensis]|uniref:Uncharacterized protein n=1 Tax=Endozoicomonas numazuensis TaxID=1137799 RepID=A0A081NKW4_9GAMM|nr:hypothetical protein [Endozoicomonas numazuensis]KEQ19087.1 hypothetical protein GZ78_03475 [Endozoicomonas numazuensis]
MADVSGPQGSSRPLYTPSPVKGSNKNTVTVLLGVILRKIRKADSQSLPSLKAEQTKSQQPPLKPPKDLKLRAAMKAEAKLFIQVLPQGNRYASSPVPKPRSSKSKPVDSKQQESGKREVESNQRSRKQKPPVAPRQGKSAPKGPGQPRIQADDLVQGRNKLKTATTDTAKLTSGSEPLYANASSSSNYENVSGREPFRYQSLYENVQTVQQEQLQKERPIPKPRSRTSIKPDQSSSAKEVKSDQPSTLNRDSAPKPAPRTHRSQSPAGLERSRPLDTYDVPRDQKVPSHYDIPKRRDTPQQPEYAEIQSRAPEVHSNPAYGEIAPPLPPRNSEKSSLDSIDPSTGENLYESIDADDMEILESMLAAEAEEVHPNDATRLVPLLGDLISLQGEMQDLIKTFKQQRPPKSKPLEWAAHIKQESQLMKQQQESKGFDKLIKSLNSLIAGELVTPQERDKVRSRVAKINAALAPALMTKYGSDGAGERVLKAPTD